MVSKYDNGRVAGLVTERIRRNVVVDDNGCWLWQGRVDPLWGYGHTFVGSRRDGSRRAAKAHRVAYEAFVGRIPATYEVDHLCKIPRCVNPAHLEAVTKAENNRRRRKPRCKYGHGMDQVDSKGSPRCGTCARQRAAEHRAKCRARSTY